MNDDDIGKLISSFVTDNLTLLVKLSSGVISGAKREIKIRLENTYKAYLNETALKYSKTRSFFIRNTSVGLYDFYVPIAIGLGNAVIDEPTYESLTKQTKRIVVVGTGGSGKSILMKHLFVGCIKTKKQVPVFVELRDLNTGEFDLLGLIEEALTSNDFDFDASYIEKAIKKGHFTFILDGYDEVINKLRKKLVSDIKSLSKKGKDCTIIISSRPDEVFAGMDEFDVYDVKSLSLENACCLVEKLPFDPEIKEKFIKELKNEIYVKHESFLSNPLLLSIMLLTYGQNAEIPTKLSIFYNQAYEALFQRHDALKGAYTRERKTNLDIQDFSKIFSVFCLQTYEKRLFGVSRIDALEYIDKSKKHLAVTLKNEDFLEDALKATCLLIEDGLQIVFSHRTFQEYFVAIYICHASPDIQKKLINKYWANVRSDNVMLLLFELNQELIERILIIPKLTVLFKTIGVTNKVGITHLTKYIKSAYSSINIEETLSATLHSNEVGLSDILHFSMTCEKVSHAPLGYDYEKAFKPLLKKYGSKDTGITRTVYDTSKLTYRQSLIKTFRLKKGYFLLNTYRLLINF